jgi:hypothetical protein
VGLEEVKGWMRRTAEQLAAKRAEANLRAKRAAREDAAAAAAAAAGSVDGDGGVGSGTGGDGAAAPAPAVVGVEAMEEEGEEEEDEKFRPEMTFEEREELDRMLANVDGVATAIMNVSARCKLGGFATDHCRSQHEVYSAGFGPLAVLCGNAGCNYAVQCVEISDTH